jgi:hypothetical protein
VKRKQGLDVLQDSVSARLEFETSVVRRARRLTALMRRRITWPG